MEDLLGGIMEFFAEPNRWSLTAPNGIPFRLIQHMVASMLATGIGAMLALPPAVWLAHHKRGEAVASAIVNIGRAIPSFGLIVFFGTLAIIYGQGQFWPLIAALVALAIPPIFTNAYTGVAQVDQAIVEAAAGQGMTDRQVLRQVELPLGLPVILTGLRIAFVQVIATVGIGAIVSSGGGLGRFVVDGFAVGQSGHGEVFVGAVLLAAVVLGAEWIFTRMQARLMPPGLRDQVTRQDDVAAPA